MKRTLDGSTDHRENNFNLLRIACAVAVLVSHAFPLTTGTASTEPLYATGLTLGMYAVVIFFAVSGFLIAGSYERRPDLTVFASARIRRILPAYLVSILIAALIIGAVVTDQLLTVYYLSSETATFIASNSVFLTAIKTLPGVFSDNPHPNTVNGSLWSLPLEVLCYCLLYCFGCFGILRHDRCWWIGSCGLLLCVTWRFIGTASPLPHVLPSFWAGVALYVYRRQIPANLSCFGALLAATYLTRDMFIHFEMTRVTIAYGALYFGTGVSTVGRKVARGGDYSYGLYLYGWPVTQAIVHFSPGLSVAGVIVTALPISGLLAIASWHLVEKRAIRTTNDTSSASRLPRSIMPTPHDMLPAMRPPPISRRV